jgi:deazaflavin-dependent oxidoreductase (nitroreductase family)
MPERCHMTTSPKTATHVPLVVRLLDPLVRPLLAIGVPMGPNTILTVPGRKSGLPRRFAVAVAEVDGRRWVVGILGEANWVRNLRSAGSGFIRVAGRQEPIVARELNQDEATAFFRGELKAYVRSLPVVARIFLSVFLGLTAPQVLNDPIRAARTLPVFELRAAR